MWGRRTYLSLAGAGVAAAALLAAGCGGTSTAPVIPVQGASGASGAGGTIALSKSQFAEQADAICGEANAALAGLNSATVGNSAQLQTAQELQIVRSELTSIQALTPPSEGRSTLDQFLSALKNEGSALSAKKTALAQGGDTSTADSELSTAKSSAQSAAQSYGFKACGKSPGAPSAIPSQTTTTLAAPPPTTATPVTPATPAPPATGGAPTGGAAPGGAPTGGAGGGGGGGGGGTGGVSP